MRRLTPFLLIFITLACGDSGPSRPVVPEPPALSWLSISPDSVLTDTVFIAVQAERAGRTVLLVDEVEAAADSVAPFVLQWDTRSTANGAHELTFLAVNEGGYADTTMDCLVDNPGGGVVVMVEPAEATLASGDSVRFGATVLGAEDRGVTWSVSSIQIAETVTGRLIPGAAGVTTETPLGSVDSTGLYTAPAVVPEGIQIAVRATSLADPAASGAAEITLTQGPAVAITSAPDEVILGRTYQLEAAVYEMEDSTLTWSVDAGAAYGTIDEDGLYTTPAVLPDPPQVTFRVTSVADPERSATAAASMILSLLITVTPATATVSEGGLQLFAATVENTGNQAVVWLILEGRRYGSINQDGIFTALAAVPDPPRATVVARSVADQRFVGTAVVDLVEGPPAGEDALLDDMFGTGVDAVNLSEQVTGIVGTALDLARSLGGDPELTRGTLEEIDDEWYFAADQPERLRVVPQNGPEWSVRFDAASGGMSPPTPGDYAPGLFFYGHLDCTIAVDGHELRLTNLSWVPAGAAKPGDVAWSTQFQRTLSGAVPDDDKGLWRVDVIHNGTSVWSENTYTFDHTIAGTAQTPGGLTVALVESLAVDYSCNCSGLVGRDGNRLVGEITVQAGSDAYLWRGLSTATYYRAGEPTGEENWLGAGTLTKNGSAYGEVELSLPLPWGLDDDPRPTLLYAHGHRLILMMPPMNDPPWTVPSPFEK